MLPEGPGSNILAHKGVRVARVFVRRGRGSMSMRKPRVQDAPISSSWPRIRGCGRGLRVHGVAAGW
eukprot:1651847-Alexandrium_andersonii.AAC.1